MTKLEQVDFVTYCARRDLFGLKLTCLDSVPEFSQLVHNYVLGRSGSSSASNFVMERVDDETLARGRLRTKAHGADHRIRRIIQIAGYRTKLDREDPRYLQIAELQMAHESLDDTSVYGSQKTLWFDNRDERRFFEIEREDAYTFLNYWLATDPRLLTKLFSNVDFSKAVDDLRRCGPEEVSDKLIEAREAFIRCSVPTPGYNSIIDFLSIELTKLLDCGLLSS